MAFVLSATGRRRRLVSLSYERAKTIASISEAVSKLTLGILPGIFAITKDQVELLRHDNIVSPLAQAEGRTLAGLGIRPEPFETLVPSYIYRYRKGGQFAELRTV